MNAGGPLILPEEKMEAALELRPQDVQLWLKRLRKKIAPSRIRFFVSGEYGDETFRPHYHAVLFGFPTCIYFRSRYSERKKNCCYWCDLVRDTWGHGHVFLGTVEDFSAQYVCGYVVKKMTSADDPRLEGRHPEFARMSLRPGIAHSAMWDVASVHLRYDLQSPEGDVIGSLREARREKPLGRYLVHSLRKMVGKSEKAPQGVLDKKAAELRPLRLAARASSENPSVKGQIVAASVQKNRRFDARTKLYRKGKIL